MKYLDKHSTADMTDYEAVRLAISSLLVVVENGAKNLEIEPMPRSQSMR
jgi:20S proteasome alpha/beta subunit